MNITKGTLAFFTSKKDCNRARLANFRPLDEQTIHDLLVVSIYLRLLLFVWRFTKGELVHGKF